MSASKVDGVLEAVRLDPQGRVLLARVYERRGPTWTDRILLERSELIARLKAKKRFYTGERVELMAGTFKVDLPVQLGGATGQEVLLTGDARSTDPADCDRLTGVPIF